jgi:hypothetical protein
MTREEFLDCSPREFDSFTERLNLRREQERWNTATVVAAIYNVNCDYSKRPQGFAPEDFLGKKRQSVIELEEFAKECEATGFKFKPNPEHDELAKNFLANLKATFSPQSLIFAKKEENGV